MKMGGCIREMSAGLMRYWNFLALIRVVQAVSVAHVLICSSGWVFVHHRKDKRSASVVPFMHAGAEM